MNTSWAGIAQRLFVGIVTGLLLYRSFEPTEWGGVNQPVTSRLWKPSG